MFTKKSLISSAFPVLLVISSDDDECCIGPICLCFLWCKFITSLPLYSNHKRRYKYHYSISEAKRCLSLFTTILIAKPDDEISCYSGWCSKINSRPDFIIFMVFDFTQSTLSLSIVKIIGAIVNIL